MVEIKSVKFTDEYNGPSAAGPDYLMGSIGDKITATIVASVHWESMNTLVVIDTVTNTITRKDSVQWDTLGFRNGDTITMVNCGGGNDGNYTISRIQSSQPGSKNMDQLLLTGALTTSGTYMGVDVHGTTPINSILHYFNLIANEAPESYLSLTDNETSQKKKATTGTVTWTVTTTVNLSNNTNSQGWDTSPTPGVDTVTKTAIINYAQIFTIVHTFTISPLFLNDQADRLWTLLLGQGPDTGIKAPFPPYFEDVTCLKYIARIEAKAVDTDPKVVHVSDWFSANNPYGVVSDKPGNTGWFDEFLNGGAADYTLTSIAYVDNATSLPLDRIDLNKQTDVTITINSAAGSFVNKGAAPGTPMLISMIYCPLDTNDYINTPSSPLLTNFRQDRLMTSAGALSANGEQYGGDLQAIVNCVVTFVSVNVCTITFSVVYSAATKAFLKAPGEDNRNYLIWVTPQKKTVTKLVDTDRNAILCAFDNADWNRDDSTQLTWNTDTLFYQYPDVTTNPKTDAKLFIADTAIVRSQIKVKIGSELRKLSVIIQAYEASTGDSFVLEQYDFDFEFLFGASNKVVIPIDVNRNFKLATTNVRNIISFARNGSIDSASMYGYDLAYAFKLRYEQWRFLADFNKAFTANPSEDWSQYSKAPGWAVQFVLQADVYDPTADYTTTFIRSANVTIKNDDDSSDGLGGGGAITSAIQTFVFVGAAYVNAGGFVLNDDTTHVVATFTGNFSSFPSGVDAYYGILSLDVEDQGGINFVDEASTDVDLLTSSLWMAKPTMTVVNPTTITIEGDIDPTKLDLQQPRYLIYARLGYKKL